MRPIPLLLLLFCTTVPAHADVWKWTDALGNVHFVESNRKIYTWLEDGKVFYADAPDHEDAVAVVLVWHAKGRVEDLGEEGEQPAAIPETDTERKAREAAEAHYCKRATEIYDSYVNAPKLYRSTEDGEREYLDEKQARAKIAETRAELDKHCK